jgi:hypothetical protein
MGVSLGQAAKLTGKGKTTLTRAIQAGRLSATRRADGGYEIDPAELARVYDVRIETPETVSETGNPVHQATRVNRSQDPERDPETVARLATMEAELKGLKELLAEVRQSRDDWRGQAERLALAPPAPRQSWWRRLVG